MKRSLLQVSKCTCPMKEATWVIHEITEETLHLLNYVTTVLKQWRDLNLSIMLWVKAVCSPEPNIKVCSIRINFNSHNNPWVEQWDLKMGEECARVGVNSICLRGCQSFVTEKIWFSQLYFLKRKWAKVSWHTMWYAEKRSNNQLHRHTVMSWF